MIFVVDLRAVGDGQISDKYQHYGRAASLMARPPIHLCQEVHFAQEAHPAQENRLLA
ncbi:MULTISPECIES: hypothetical protein [unclassified Mesorhizobium]|jgi:hypothetical protein|uniref:hypothetical protein n=1 Tax=unclassified Mesorhizobium TaxID=325217 RepID=UPI0024171660|nr:MULTISPECIES: hypothetical protein [unclassified Mesorhizobium]MDG4898019.1 hypothetical protein [Mesorhizobium sp. WSM4976]